MNTKTIAFQGAIGANSHLACQKFYPDLAVKNFFSFAEVFDAVEKGEVEFGMIPLENSYAGRVAEIHNLLLLHKVSIVAEHFVTIEHHLAAPQSARLEDIEKVYSHPQALMQCRNSIRELLGKKITDASSTVEMSNTAEAAKYVAAQGDKTKAALCSKLAAQENGLKILQEHLQDDKENFTIFVVISKQPQDADPEVAPVITSMIFTIRNVPGALYKALGGLATNGVSMLKIESYIPSGSSKQANFFISLQGHPSQKNVALALEELGFFSQSVKVIGVYYADKRRGL